MTHRPSNAIVSPLLFSRALAGVAALLPIIAASPADAQCDAREWRDATPATLLRSHTRLGAGYDSARGRVVVMSIVPADEQSNYVTWEWDGESMTYRSAFSTAALHVPTLVEDPSRDVLVASGTFNGQGTFGEWNGATWRPWTPDDAATPPPAAMAYDYDAGRLMMVAPGANGQMHTWVSDGETWGRISTAGPANAPVPGMVYDRARQVMVLNITSALSSRRDTWEWVAGAWTLVAERHVAGNLLTYDTVNQRVLAGNLNCVHAWDGAAWREVACAPTLFDAMAFDEGRGTLVAFARSLLVGKNAHTGTGRMAVWELDPKTEAFVTALPNPLGRTRNTAVFDEARGEIIVFGGMSVGEPGSILVNDTMRFDGEWWEKLQPGVAPSARIDYAAAFDSVRNEVVLFGGGTNSSILAPGTTWAWSGSAWTEHDVPGPARRQNTAMAFDRARGRMVLFGGRALANNYFGDTWEWDGAAWTSVSNAGPSRRHGHAMAYDEASGRVFLAGGRNDQGSLDDVWAWDGAAWEKVGVLPPGRSEGVLFDAVFSLAYDRGRRQLVMASRAADLSFELSGWDGSAWTPLENAPAGNTDNPFGGRMLFNTVTNDINLVAIDFRVFIPGATTPPSGFFTHPIAQKTVREAAVLRVAVNTSSPVEYQWRLNGDPIEDGGRFLGARTAVLETYTSGTYHVVVSNGCGTIVSQAAEVVVIRVSDWNEDREVNSQDFFDFLVDFFAGDADFNADGVTNSQDFFNFVTCFLSRC